ncbi:hypothetical protein PSHT_01603 [Puccinia striiformis]|uniref:Uncharacterized protein n=2 Tax=Puccinia striiformis TaxID=27350 RepID=A0A0L0V8U4_9BASI|nr:hypothetical protein PSTG_10930 [Puccinia striiformis f. sp. tritici PST-78]POW22135.1 hypothetical protein PSHT_01603 [Puccinia striiformis]
MKRDLNRQTTSTITKHVRSEYETCGAPGTISVLMNKISMVGRLERTEGCRVHGLKDPEGSEFLSKNVPVVGSDAPQEEEAEQPQETGNSLVDGTLCRSHNGTGESQVNRPRPKAFWARLKEGTQSRSNDCSPSHHTHSRLPKITLDSPLL